jgi:hypothetical protein
MIARSFRAGASSSQSTCWSDGGPARRPYRHLARGRRYDPAKSSLHHRCVRRLARSPACGLDAAARRRRFLDSLAPRQGPFCQGAAKTGTAQCRPRGPQRTRHLAASVLGASDPRRVMCAMSNIAASIRSSTDWSRVCAIGRIRRFIATCARVCFRQIGAAMSKSPVSSGSADREAARATWYSCARPGTADYAFWLPAAGKAIYDSFARAEQQINRRVW